jgi:hypothetical protein
VYGDYAPAPAQEEIRKPAGADTLRARPPEYP